MLLVRNISKKFPERSAPAVKEIDLFLKEGEVAGLVGPSGSGKTTLLRLLAGLEEPGSGFIEFQDERVVGPADQLIAGHKAIRLVHQHFELAHRLSVYQNVAQKLRHLVREEQNSRTKNLLEVCHLGHLAENMVEELSGGEKQRLALARALAEEPELLLLDEPFSHMDPHLKAEIREKLFAYIRSKGLSAILVSHDPKDALSLADTLWVMQHGRLMQQGSPQQVYQQPENPAIAKLFGSINLCQVKAILPFLKAEARQFVENFPPEGWLGIRPEAVLPAARPEEAHLEGVLQETFFYGSHYEANVGLGKELVFRLRLPSSVSYSQGASVRLKMQLNSIRLFTTLPA